MSAVLCDFDRSGVCRNCGYVSRESGLMRHCVPRAENGGVAVVPWPTVADLPYAGEPVNAATLQSPGNAFGVPSGPGTELKKLLARIGISATDSCPCNARAAEMDANGADWCEANASTIVGWLREQAQARGLPFLDVVGLMLVRKAIRNARQSSQRP